MFPPLPPLQDGHQHPCQDLAQHCSCPLHQNEHLEGLVFAQPARPPLEVRQHCPLQDGHQHQCQDLAQHGPYPLHQNEHLEGLVFAQPARPPLEVRQPYL